MALIGGGKTHNVKPSDVQGIAPIPAD